MAFTSEEFGAFFEAMKNGTYKCPFCGNESFFANQFAAAEMAIFPIPVTTELGSPVSQTHSFFSFSCQRCGHTDFFHFNQVKAWIDSRNAEQSNG